MTGTKRPREEEEAAHRTGTDSCSAEDGEDGANTASMDTSDDSALLSKGRRTHDLDQEINALVSSSPSKGLAALPGVFTLEDATTALARKSLQCEPASVQESLERLRDAKALQSSLLTFSAEGDEPVRVYWRTRTDATEPSHPASVQADATTPRKPLAPATAKSPISPALKSRLQRQRLPFVSPVLKKSVPQASLAAPTQTHTGGGDATPMAVAELAEEGRAAKLPVSVPAAQDAPSETPRSSPAEAPADSGDLKSLRSECSELEAALKQKQEKLRKLRMVKMYREKNDLTQLQDLIEKWIGVSQAAIEELRQKAPEPISLGVLLNMLQIDHKLIRYNETEEGFA